LWSIIEYCEASRQTSGSATSSNFMIGSGVFTPRPQPLMIPSSRIRVRAGKGALARNLELLLPRGRQIGIILRDVVHEDVQITSGLTPTTEVAPLFGHLVANGRAWLLWSFGHPGLPHFFTEISFAAMIVSVARVATKANHKIPILEAGD
jgi:hypothetical protein